VLLKRGYVVVIAPLLLGKITMAAEMFLLLWLMLTYSFAIPFPPILINLVAGLIICSLLGYLSMFLRLKRERV